MKRYELPKDWRWVRLGEVVSEIKSGFACGKQHAVPGGIPHLRTNNIGINGELDLSVLIYLPAEIVDLNTYSLKSGDVLFNNTNSIELVGKTAIVRENLPFVFSNHITRLRVNQDVIESEWLTLSLQYLWYQRFFERECQRWIGQAGFNTMRLKKVQISLPPLPEQRRIVARIEEPVNRIEEAKRLRRAAREETDAIMPAALHRIFCQAEAKGWPKVRLAETCLKTERRDPRKESFTDFIYIDISSVDNTTGRIVDPKIIRSEDAPSRARKVIRTNDLIFATTRPYLKSIALVTPDLDNQICSTGFCVLRADPAKALPDWFFHVCRSELVLNQVIPLMRGANYPAVSDKDVFAAKVPLPALSEQRWIVAYPDRPASQCGTT